MPRLVILTGVVFFFFNDTATPQIYPYGHTLSLHDALPIGLEQVNLGLRRARLGWETIRGSGSIPQEYWSPRESPGPAPAEAPDSTENSPEASPEIGRAHV